MSEIVIAGNTSGSVTIAAPDVAGTTTLTLPASSGTVLDDASVGVCRAWVNFNGTGTVAIRASFNVSSITDNGTGDYTTNFTTAMVDANYVIQGGGITSAGTISVSIGLKADSGSSVPTLKSTTQSRIVCASTAAFDPFNASVLVFR